MAAPGGGMAGLSAGGSRDYRITQAPLGDIFGAPSIFVIPEYTRAFSWPVAHVQTLLEDLKLACHNGTEQFLGTLTFGTPNPGEPPEVVDGQQRMVVLFMILSYLHSWAAASGLHDLRAALWKCLCHDQGTAVDGAPWVTYRLNFSHQAIAKFFKDNMLNQFMPVVFVEAEGQPVVHGGSMGAIPMPNKLMWHLYQTASHVKRHLDTLLHTANGPLNAERLFVHLVSKCFVVAVLCQGKERGPAIFAHLNSTGMPLSSNDCLKAKLLAKLPPENHQSFLAKWREMEEILGAADIRKFLEYVKQLEEFMGTMPQLQDAYQYFSLKIASVDNSKPIVDGIFSHASVFIQRTKLKRLQEMSEAAGHSGHGQQNFHQFQAMNQSAAAALQMQRHHSISASMGGGISISPMPRHYSIGHVPTGTSGVPVPGAMTIHGGGDAKAAMEAALAGDGNGHEAFSSTAPARLELLGGNTELMNSLLAQHQAHAQAAQHSMQVMRSDSFSIDGSVHGAHAMSGLEGSQHGRNNMEGSVRGGAQQTSSSHHGSAEQQSSLLLGGGNQSQGNHAQAAVASASAIQAGGGAAGSDDPFNWCPTSSNFDTDDYFKSSNHP
mmetsp:Transcript_10969/g.30983  ORF Transcript_10969/g.30983 Transcript_10969/m.30983 type:complete len:605 (-) Transcript_10969:66-1880(-)